MKLKMVYFYSQFIEHFLICKGFFFILVLLFRGILKSKHLNLTVCNTCIIIKAFRYSDNLSCANPVIVVNVLGGKSIWKRASLQIQDIYKHVHCIEKMRPSYMYIFSEDCGLNS